MLDFCDTYTVGCSFPNSGEYLLSADRQTWTDQIIAKNPICAPVSAFGDLEYTGDLHRIFKASNDGIEADAERVGIDLGAFTVVMVPDFRKLGAADMMDAAHYIGLPSADYWFNTYNVDDDENGHKIVSGVMRAHWCRDHINRLGAL